MRGVVGQKEEESVEVRRSPFRYWVPLWDTFPVGRNCFASGSGEVTSFYIVEFPDSVKACDLFGLFGYIGNMVEVSIAPRRNKRGKCFGFARFKEVEDSRVLAVSLDNVQ